MVLIEKLRNAGCLVSAYDPVAIPEAQRRLPEDVISYVKDIYEAVIDADALLLVTEWKEFRMPSWSVIKKLMATPLILDGRNIYDKAELEEAGFHLSLHRSVKDLLVGNKLWGCVAILCLTQPNCLFHQFFL